MIRIHLEMSRVIHGYTRVLILGESDNLSFTEAYISLNPEDYITCTFYEKKNLPKEEKDLLKEKGTIKFISNVDATKFDMNGFDKIIFCFPFYHNDTKNLIINTVENFIKTAEKDAKLLLGLAVTKPNKIRGGFCSSSYYSTFTECLILNIIKDMDVMLVSVSSFKPYIKEGYKHVTNYGTIESKDIWDSNVKAMFTLAKGSESKQDIKSASDIIGTALFPDFYPRLNLKSNGTIPQIFINNKIQALRKIKQDFDF